MNYSVNEIAKLVEVDYTSPSDQIISHVSVDSRSVQNTSNSVFFALVTNKRNGHEFIQDLIDRGVNTFVISEDIKVVGDNLSIIRVSNTLEALQRLAANHRKKFNIPVIGITGSYGKTIVKEWLNQL